MLARFDQVVAAELLLGLREGTIGGERLAVAYTHGFGGCCGLERVATFNGTRVLLAESAVLGEFSFGISVGKAGFALRRSGLDIAFSFPPATTTFEYRGIDSW